MTFYIILLLILNLTILFSHNKLSSLVGLYDYPDNIRKIHKFKTSLIGGFWILINLFIYCLFDYLNFFGSNFFDDKYEIVVFLTFSLIFFVIGYLDDKYNLSANIKLLIYISLLFILVSFNSDLVVHDLNFKFNNWKINLLSFEIFFTVLCFLLFINALNMLDGINGQVATYIIFISIIFFLLKINLIFFLTLVVVLLFFLYLNFKNKIFLGDNGSILLGFIISYFFVKSYNMGFNLHVDEIFLIMMVPGYELFRLALSRLIKKKHPFKADNQHIHHLMIVKIGYLRSYLLIQILLVLPYMFYLLIQNSLLSFLFSTILYSSTIFILKKNDL
jgi:UDP-GlcNAc:undecaprenyl-phosphate GlcNAc-1-phosphate transferase